MAWLAFKVCASVICYRSNEIDGLWSLFRFYDCSQDLANCLLCVSLIASIERISSSNRQNRKFIHLSWPMTSFLHFHLTRASARSFIHIGFSVLMTNIIRIHIEVFIQIPHYSYRLLYAVNETNRFDSEMSSCSGFYVIDSLKHV